MVKCYLSGLDYFPGSKYQGGPLSTGPGGPQRRPTPSSGAPENLPKQVGPCKAPKTGLWAPYQKPTCPHRLGDLQRPGPTCPCTSWTGSQQVTACHQTGTWYVGLAWLGHCKSLTWSWLGHCKSLTWSWLAHCKSLTWSWLGHCKSLTWSWLGHCKSLTWSWLGHSLGLGWVPPRSSDCADHQGGDTQ